MKLYIFSFCLLICVYNNYAQYDGLPARAIIPGSVPARAIQIPGAIPFKSGGQRQGRLLAPVRRPTPGFYRASPIQNTPPPQFLSQSVTKPVSEDPDEDSNSSLDNIADRLEEQVAQKQALLSQINQNDGFSSLSQSTASIPQSSPSPAFQFRPEPKVIPQIRQPIQRVQPIRNEPRQIQQQVVQRARPAPRPIPQEISARDYSNQEEHRRNKKPVAQILRKYREENPDGSITWGYENDDGTFKEETIGVDCITRGKYGYVDPDGVRREYTYETGLPCDTPFEEEELIIKGEPQQQQIQLQAKPRPRPKYNP